MIKVKVIFEESYGEEGFEEVYENINVLEVVSDVLSLSNEMVERELEDSDGVVGLYYENENEKELVWVDEDSGVIRFIVL